jgi:hypothetical protein
MAWEQRESWPLNLRVPGPLHAPPLWILFPFLLRDSVTRKWVRARYVAEQSEVAARYQQ